ncbi:MAG TPA: trypsin-like peptidase domain-containing protein [Bryobacteraceae bacterium]|nr:trypsin-like peptidase domain-containing protein [Bryobacteraceae bacterium]
MGYHGTAALVCLVMAPTAFGQAHSSSNPLAELSASIHELARNVAPAVVEIIVNGYASADDDSGHGGNEISRQRSNGSGVIVDPGGYIMTNAHLVRGAVHLEVLLPVSGDTDPPARLQARIMGVDSDSDLALIRIEKHNLHALSFGDSDQLRQGDLVFAVGSPLGLRNSISMGVVSAPERAIDDDNPILYIQTDASINPGNSGGALVDSEGRLIGLSTFIVSKSGGNEGIGFAVPSNLVQNVYKQLRSKGSVSRGSVGLFAQNINPILARGLGLPISRGVLVADIDSNGPADRAGIKRCDVILSINGQPMRSSREFENYIYGRRGGEKIEVEFERSGERLNAALEVTEKTPAFDPLAALASPAKNLVRRLGILCIEIDQRVAKLMPDLRRQYGLVVAAKSPEGQAQFIDIQPGDVIHAINNLTVVSLDAFQDAVKELSPGDAVALQIERDGRFRYVAFEMD